MGTFDRRTFPGMSWLGAIVVVAAASGACMDTSASSGAGAAASGSASAAAPAHGLGAHRAAADPCAVVTETDATVALGSDPGAGQSSVTAAGTRRCTYSSDAGNLMVTVTPNQTEEDFTRAHDKAAKDARGGTFVEVPEVGHGAFSTWGGPMASIQFYKDATAVYIMLMIAARPSSPKSQVTALAVAAAGRI